MEASCPPVAEHVRPTDGDEPLGAEPAGMYERKTQSPLVWHVLWPLRGRAGCSRCLLLALFVGRRLNLRKSNWPNQAPMWYNVEYQEDAKYDLQSDVRIYTAHN